jgi:hypothetical protein
LCRWTATSGGHEFHGDWNYDVHPTADDDHEALATPITPTRPKKRK